MRRIGKLIGILFIFFIVSFIIVDERGLKIQRKDNHLILVPKQNIINADVTSDIEQNDIIKQENSIEQENVLEKENISKQEDTSQKIVYIKSSLVKMYIGFKNPSGLRTGVGIEIPKKSLVYKNPNFLHIYSGFKQSEALRLSNGMDEGFLAKVEEERLAEEARRESKKYKGPNIISLDTNSNISNIFSVDSNETEQSVVQNETEQSVVQNETNQPVNINSGEMVENSPSENTENVKKENEKEEVKQLNNPISYDGNNHDLNLVYGDRSSDNQDTKETQTENTYNIIPRYQGHTHTLNTGKIVVSQKVIDGNQQISDNQIEGNTITEIIDDSVELLTGAETTDDNSLDKDLENDVIKNGDIISESGDDSLEDNSSVDNKPIIKISRYEPKYRIALNMLKGVRINPEFLLQNQNIQNVDSSSETEGNTSGLPESLMTDILIDDEIDVNALESENDEFLQKVFDKTHDISVMNLIIETYLNEYQFVKAKKFIENLPSSDKEQINPILYIRTMFNSFPLTSKTAYSSLTTMVQSYQAKGQISNEDSLRYLGVISLMKQDYEHFFEIAGNFTLEEHKSFTDKLQGYKEQISKQMGMPDYYFDTLVALELFNKGFFQPAKVLALYSLQQNSSYILPYQVLAYANFLTSSRDTAIEYLKKLIDIDPNNADNYRFLMGIANYRDGKYEQSVVMLSLVKNNKFRLDAERYLVRNYILLDQKNKLISIWNKLLGYDDLVSSDFYTYFYEVFYRPYAEGLAYQLYAFDTELANKMLRVCTLRLPEKEQVVCNYGNIGRNIALGQFDGLEESLLQLASDYPQGYLYHALGEYYLQQGNMEKAKIYLLKAVSMTQKVSEIVQVKKLLQSTID